MANITILVGLVVVLSAVASVMSSQNDNDLLTSRVPPTDEQVWQQFKVKYNRQYSSPEEEASRKALFMKSVRFVRNHNDKYLRGETSSAVEINKFSDRTDAELPLGLVPPVQVS